ncbi:MAG: cyclic nucleotide-binding/CBS domain-containing protein [Candidatus Aenigmatarchaeota archaeon]
MPIKVKDVMSARVISCSPGTTVAAAAKTMRDEDVGSIVIIEGKKPVGIATREDITNKVAAENKQPSEVLVKDIMTSPVITAASDEDLADVARRMNQFGYERMPVKYLDKLVGFISVRDILRVSPGLLELMKESLEDIVPEGFEAEFNAGDCELCGNFDEQLRNVNDRWVCAACQDEAAEI